MQSVFLKRKLSKVLRLRRLLDVERQKTNSQADVLRFGGESLQISQHLDRSKEQVARLQARCHEIWRHLEPTQYLRVEGYFPRAGVASNGKISLNPLLLVVEEWLLMTPT